MTEPGEAWTMTLYEIAGGHDRLLAMTTMFYESALADDVIGDMFSRAAGDHAGHLASWLAASFGGPSTYPSTRGDLRFVVWKHAGLDIDEAQRERWAKLMMEAAVKVGMPSDFLHPFERFVDSVSRSVRENSNRSLESMRARLGIAPGGSLDPIDGHR